MKPLVIANIEHIEAQPFLVALLFGEDGYLADGLTLPYEGPTAAIERIAQLGLVHGFETVEMWTSDTALYVEALKVPGVGAVYKHPSDTRLTREAIERDAELLRDLYDIPPLIPKPRLPKWRAFLARIVRGILKRLEGDGEYEV